MAEWVNKYDNLVEQARLDLAVDNRKNLELLLGSNYPFHIQLGPGFYYHKGILFSNLDHVSAKDMPLEEYDAQTLRDIGIMIELALKDKLPVYKDAGYFVFSTGMPYLDALQKTRTDGLEMLSNSEIGKSFFPEPRQRAIWLSEILAHCPVGERIGAEILDTRSEKRAWRLVDIEPQYRGQPNSALFVRDFEFEITSNIVTIIPKKEGITLISDFPTDILGWVWRSQYNGIHYHRVGPTSRFSPAFYNSYVDAQESPNRPLGVIVREK